MRLKTAQRSTTLRWSFPQSTMRNILYTCVGLFRLFTSKKIEIFLILICFVVFDTYCFEVYHPKFRINLFIATSDLKWFSAKLTCCLLPQFIVDWLDPIDKHLSFIFTFCLRTNRSSTHSKNCYDFQSCQVMNFLKIQTLLFYLHYI